MAPPPGITYLLHYVPRLCVPFLIVYAGLSALSLSHSEVVPPTWTVTLAYVLCLPVYVQLRATIRYLLRRKRAKDMGARFVPHFKMDSTPGSVLSIAQGLKRQGKEYPGDPIKKVFDAVGGTFSLSMLFEERIMTLEPEHIKAILATQFEDFEKGELTRHFIGTLLGTGVFVSDGEMWKFHRGMTRPFFSKDRISDFDLFDRHADVALEKIKERCKENVPFDFQDLVGRFTLDSATEFLFGKDFKSLADPLPYPFYVGVQNDGFISSSSEFAEAFNTAQVQTAFRMRFAIHWPLADFWGTKVANPMEVVRKHLDPILASAIERKRVSKLQPEAKVETHENEIFLEHLLEHTSDPIILRDEIMNLATAGRDTTASTLTFAVYMLAENPKVMKRLRDEIFEKVGASRRPTFDDFREMKYLRAFINETLRLYTPVPFNLRQAKRDTTLPSLTPGGKPFFVPEGTMAVWSALLMHRREDLWGPDALLFDPDRFLDERLHKYLTPNPFIFLPFNAGPRICLGQQFAYHETSFFLVRLLQTFSSFALAPEAQPLDSRPPPEWKAEGGIKAREKVIMQPHLTMYVKGGLWVTMEEASNEDISS